MGPVPAQVNTNPLTITSSADIKANVTFTNFIACKAIEHVLDTVLVPQSVGLPLLLPTAFVSVLANNIDHHRVLRLLAQDDVACHDSSGREGYIQRSL